jgi:hypothetical protein
VGVAVRPCAARADTAANAASCEDQAPAPEAWLGERVGVERCRILKHRVVLNAKGQRFVRLEIALDGTVRGWAVLRRQPHGDVFTDAPDLVFAQLGVTGPRYRGIARYEAARGSGMTLFVPLKAKDWNGKLFVTAHGGRAYATVGTLVPRNGALAFHPFADVNKYVGLMIDKGYAVAFTRRSSATAPGRGDMTVTLADGRTVTGYQVGLHVGLMVSWAQLASNIVRHRLGRAPTHVYFYGFGSGATIGRLLNDVSRLNDDRDGHAVFDGILADDAGPFLPVLRKGGRDVLFADAAARAQFVKQIDVAHTLYDAPGSMRRLLATRRNARLLRRKGLGDRHRLYEIRGVSHYDAGYGPEDLVGRRDLAFQNIDLTPVISALIDRLDAWVDAGKPPPATRSDDPLLGGVDADGKVIHPAVALPPIACPLGVYHVYPVELGNRPIGLKVTGFAAFDGINPEPLDGLGRLVDMNGNGRRDRRESLVEAWRRLGLVAKNEGFTRLVYTSCVTQVAERLAKEGLIPRAAELYYQQRAPSTLLPQAVR